MQKRKNFFSPFCLFNLILCWTLFIAKNLWKIAKYILKTAQTFGTLAPDAVTYHSDWSKVMTKEKVSSSLDCLWMLVMKHFNTHNVWLTDISEPLTPKIKLSDNQFYMHCKAISPLQIGGWGNVLICHVSLYVSENTESPHVSVSVFRGRIPWCFSLSKSNISPAAPDLEFILFPLWYWPIMNAHTKQQQDNEFETDFIDTMIVHHLHTLWH